MDRLQQAINMGWVENCTQCSEVRDLIAKLKISRYAMHADKVEVICGMCNGRGWILTGEGQTLVDLVAEIHPDLVKGEEIPF